MGVGRSEMGVGRSEMGVGRSEMGVGRSEMGVGRSEMGQALRSFEDLEVWQMARSIVNQVYMICREDPVLTRDFGLSGQLQRAAVSIMSNLAEGFERLHVQEKIQFYSIARGSCGEVRSLLYVVADNYPNSADRGNRLKDLVSQAGRLISGLIRSTRDRKTK